MEKFKTTCVIIHNENDEVLVIRRGRAPYKGYWSLISGMGEFKEEVEWELGTNLLNAKHVLSIPVKDNQYTDEILVFSGNVVESQIKLRPGSSEDFQWISIKDEHIFEYLAFEQSQVLREYLRLVENSLDNFQYSSNLIY
jgi:hypothetical protein